MDTNQRIKQFMDARGWTEYRLAREAGLSQSTIANIFGRNTVPGITTLEAICRAFGITLAQFFAEGELVELDTEQRALFDRYVTLTAEQKKLILQLIDQMK